jgi:hypothetical protein
VRRGRRNCNQEERVKRQKGTGPTSNGKAPIAWLLAAILMSGMFHPAVAQQAVPAQPSLPPEAAAPRANDFPTLARVEYVFECLSENAGPRHEMVYKCVCAVDRVAEAISYDRWVDLSTFFKAQPMAGERGAYVRERSDIQAQLKSYREVQQNAKKACFIRSGGN